MNTLRRILFALFLAVAPLSAFSAPVNVNTADAAALAENLNGVGPKIAAAIVAYRKEHGPFRKVEDLLQVKGIGPKILERIRPDVRLDNRKQAAK